MFGTENKKINLKCMYANACSIINKFVAFEAMVCNYEPDVIGIAESWAHNGINDSEIALKGYDLFRCDRQVNVRGMECCFMSNMVWVQCK